MLSAEQLDFLATFGYAVADAGALSDVVTDLREESRRALTRAYPARPAGTMKLPAMSSETPVSRALFHDDRLLAPARAVLGGDVIVTPAKITRYGQPTDWHNDCDLELRGVKCVVYLEVVPAGVISFEVVPASHRAPVRDYLERLFQRERPVGTSTDPPRHTADSRLPVYTLQLSPGQPLFIDLALWHANLSSADRLQWTVTYLASPANERALERTVDYLGWFFDYPHDYPHEVFPYLPPSWESRESHSPLLGAMRECGVLDRYLERYGPGR